MHGTVAVSPNRVGLLVTLLALAHVACVSDTNLGSELQDAGRSDEPETGNKPGHDADAGETPGEDDAGETVPSDAPLIPWKEGNTWTYRVLSGGVEATKVITIGAEERVGGTGPNSEKLAFKVTTTKGATDRTVSFRALLDGRVVRYREQSFSALTQEVNNEEHWVPYKLYMDQNANHLAAGASWIEEYEETKQPLGLPVTVATKRDAWVVDSVSERVIVPAGTFQAIVLQKSGGTTVKTYWFVPGVGKVRETGGQTEELVSYEVSP